MEKKTLILALCALVAEEDEALLERYLNGDIPPRETLLPRVAQMTRDCAAYPALRGSALRGSASHRHAHCIHRGSNAA